MGGKGSGGRRAGSGRKSKDPVQRWVRGHGPRPAAPVVDASAPLLPPATLTEAERAVWLELEPHARAAGTLTPASLGDFCILVGLMVEVSELLAARRAEGLTTRGLKLATAFRGTVQRLEIKMRGFALAPLGKSIAPAPAAEPDPFAEFDTPLVEDTRYL